jgi:hypothetical protein
MGEICFFELMIIYVSVVDSHFLERLGRSLSNKSSSRDSIATGTTDLPSISSSATAESNIFLSDSVPTSSSVIAMSLAATLASSSEPETSESVLISSRNKTPGKSSPIPTSSHLSTPPPRDKTTPSAVRTTSLLSKLLSSTNQNNANHDNQLGNQRLLSSPKSHKANSAASSPFEVLPQTSSSPLASISSITSTSPNVNGPLRPIYLANPQTDLSESSSFIHRTPEKKIVHDRYIFYDTNYPWMIYMYCFIM